MMHKSLLILAVLYGTAGFGQLPNATEIAPKMYPGWNLGNTLEGGGTDNVYTNHGGLGAERAWQGTTTTQEIIDYVAAQGFKSIRIPAAWVMGHIIDRSRPAVFDQNSLDGIMEGAGAAVWGGPTAGIQGLTGGKTSCEAEIYDLAGRRVKNVGKGLYVIGGKVVYLQPKH